MMLTQNRDIRRSVLRLLYQSMYRYSGIDEVGEEVLKRLRDSVKKPVTEQDTSKLRVSREYWVKYYLEQFSGTYGIEIVGNLDEETRQCRGDYRVRYNGQEMVLEVEKDVQNFLDHGHSTAGEIGWDNPASIDLVLAASDDNQCREELGVPVILASEQTRDDEDVPSFEQWFRRVNEIKSWKETFYAHLLMAVYYELFKGVPSLFFILKEGPQGGDEFGFEIVKRYVGSIHAVAGEATQAGVDTVLFGGDESVDEDQTFQDVKLECIEAVRDLSSDSVSWTCSTCGNMMRIIGRDLVVYDADPVAMSDGEYADQLAAHLGGFFDEDIHGETISVSYCFDCSIIEAKAPMDNSPFLADNSTPFDPDDTAACRRNPHHST